MDMSRLLLAGGVLALLGAVAPPAAAVEETGLHTMHKRARTGGKICMTEHYHVGEDGPSATRTHAIRKWQVFTIEEYGRAWGSYVIAAGKSMTCKQESNGWTCTALARPCRSGGGGKR
jgi:hypothetical protein